jgi:hypothetical protein
MDTRSGKGVVGHRGEFQGKDPLPSKDTLMILLPVAARATAPSNREGREAFRK